MRVQCAGGIRFALVRVKVKRYHIRKGMKKIGIKKESIQMLRIKNKATSQVTFDEDYNVPDVKPDIGRMVQSKAEVSMDEVRLSEGEPCLREH